MKRDALALVVVLALAAVAIALLPEVANPAPVVHFVGAGDIAVAGGKQAATAREIAVLNPDAVFTTGDNVYPSGAASGVSIYRQRSMSAMS
jgi:hypothetical protein